MPKDSLDYVVRMDWNSGVTHYYGPYNRASAKRVATLCDKMDKTIDTAEVVELKRFVDAVPSGLDEPVMCRNCGEILE